MFFKKKLQKISYSRYHKACDIDIVFDFSQKKFYLAVLSHNILYEFVAITTKVSAVFSIVDETLYHF